MLEVYVVVDAVLSVMCTKKNLLRVTEYAKETNMLVKLKVADNYCVVISVCALLCVRKFGWILVKKKS